MQGILESLIVLKILIGSSKKATIGVIFVSDGESTDQAGIKAVIENRIFEREDRFIILDHASENGSHVVVGEKSRIWIRFEINSTSQEEVNALNASAEFFHGLDTRFREAFSNRNDLFEHPASRFDLTLHEQNVDSISSVPRSEIQYSDIKLNPLYDPDLVLDLIHNECREFENTHSVSIRTTVLGKKVSSMPLGGGSGVLKALSSAILRTRGFSPRAIGIDSGTPASVLRIENYDAAAWMSGDKDVLHSPNEYSRIMDIVEDVRTLLAIFSDSDAA